MMAISCCINGALYWYIQLFIMDICPTMEVEGGRIGVGDDMVIKFIGM